MKTALYLLLLLPLGLQAQSIKGHIYDAKGPLHGIHIYNTTQNTGTVSDAQGRFEMEAAVSDTLYFESLFHESQTLVITEEHFKEPFVIELKKVLNTLDAVILEATPKAKPFVAKEYQVDLTTQIAEDIRKHPEKYTKPPSGNGVNIMALGKLIGKLIKPKHPKPPKPAEIYPISYQQLVVLFSDDPLFNDQLISETWQIPLHAKALFFEYCSSKNIDGIILATNNHLQLLEILGNYSMEFKALLDAAEKD